MDSHIGVFDDFRLTPLSCGGGETGLDMAVDFPRFSIWTIVWP
jgi:hypothetical protein